MNVELVIIYNEVSQYMTVMDESELSQVCYFLYQDTAEYIIVHLLSWVNSYGGIKA